MHSDFDCIGVEDRKCILWKKVLMIYQLKLISIGVKP